MLIPDGEDEAASSIRIAEGISSHRSDSRAGNAESGVSRGGGKEEMRCRRDNSSQQETSRETRREPKSQNRSLIRRNHLSFATLSILQLGITENITLFCSLLPEASEEFILIKAFGCCLMKQK
jgi:hypothetical protein